MANDDNYVSMDVDSDGGNLTGPSAQTPTVVSIVKNVSLYHDNIIPLNDPCNKQICVASDADASTFASVADHGYRVYR